MWGDLHTHTNFSDGSSDIERLPVLAARTGLDWLAVSDHDSMQSVQYALAHPVDAGVHLLPAAELTAFDRARGRRVHLLCYCPRPTGRLQDFCRLMADRRNAAARRSMAVLEQMYPQFRAQDAAAFAARSGVVYKTHQMRVLFEAGFTDSIYGPLYRQLFGRDGPARFDPAYESVETVLDIIRDAGGVAVLAHPSVYNSMELAAQLAETGAIDGVEIDHPRNSEQDKQVLRGLAARYGLIATGGSDFHGMHASRPVPVGAGRTDGENIRRILALAGRRGGAVPSGEG